MKRIRAILDADTVIPERPVPVRKIYSKLPYPENQPVSLAHSLVARGVIDERGAQGADGQHPRQTGNLTPAAFTPAVNHTPTDAKNRKLMTPSHAAARR